MPFTFSHPALVLPLQRLRVFSVTGLVAGSLAPDFEYYIRMTDKRMFTHTWQGMLWFDLPLALVLAFTFHLVVRNPLLHQLPKRWQQRLLPFCAINWLAVFRKRFAQVIFSTLIGVVSHLLWDEWTHEGSRFRHILPFLNQPVHIGNFQTEGHFVLQVVSSLAGALVVFWAIWRLPVRPLATHPVRPSFWLGILLLFVVILGLRIGLLHTGPYENNELEDLLIPVLSAFLWSLLLVCAATGNRLNTLKKRNWRDHKTETKQSH